MESKLSLDELRTEFKRYQEKYEAYSLLATGFDRLVCTINPTGDADSELRSVYRAQRDFYEDRRDAYHSLASKIAQIADANFGPDSVFPES